MPSLVGESEQIKEVRALVEKVAPLDIQVLVTGETGTGKDVVARLIHAKSNRKQGPFVPVNCGAIPDSLLESALFGHEKGAFTGATGRAKGFFHEAKGGTLFLDEISEGSHAFQTALLRVLQEKRFFSIGSTRQQTTDCRIIAATNRDLRLEVTRGTFREDLYFRLNIFEIKMPPLRDREDDVFLLSSHYLGHLSSKYKKVISGLSPAVRAVFQAYHWPGNVRELFHVLERAVIVEAGSILTLQSLPKYLQDRLETEYGTDGGASFFHAHQETTDADGIFQMPIAEARKVFEKRYLERLLHKTKGNVSMAAKLAGIRRQNLYRKLEQLGIEPVKFRKRSD